MKEPTEDHLERAIKIRGELRAISYALESLGYMNSDLSHAYIKMSSAERGLDDFINKCQGKYQYKFEW
jgi:hypothetical protein